MTGPDAPTLRLDEAVELCAPWLQAAGRERGIRSLVIKGPLLAAQGLRRERVSSDIDLLVEPGRFDDFVAVVEGLGWEEFPGTFASSHFTLHSRTFRRTGWPNSVDVHSYYPGFLRDPAEVFDVLWSRRVAFGLGHRACDATDRIASLFVLALHSLRGTVKQPRHQDELDQVRAVRLSEAEQADVASLALATGSAVPLRELLPGWGVSVAVDESTVRTPEYREWRRKITQAKSESAIATWLLLLARAPWLEKAGVVRRALWPAREDFAIAHPEVPDRPWPQFAGRMRRLWRGIARLPRAVVALLRR